MKRVLLFCLFISFPALSKDHDYKQFLLEATKVSNQVKEQTKDKNLVGKIAVIEDFSKELSNNPLALDILMQMLGVQYSFAGLHNKALAVKDLNAESGESVAADLTDYKPKDAISEILKRAQTHQIVMINEAHDIAQHRVLTYRMLSGLWNQGYRYFAAESLSREAAEQIDKGYFTNNIGYYTQEAIYANLVLKAKALGFKIISYDMHKPSKLNTIDERETNSAQTIMEKVFDKDPNAKIIIHVGYSHISEDKWLASKLKEATNLETLTVDQTTRRESSNKEYEDPTYTKAVNDVTLQSPFIFVNGEEAWSSEPEKWDISVFWPRTSYLDGRPKWASLERKAYKLDASFCKNRYPCLVEAYRFNHDNEVPSDRIILSSKEDTKALFLSQGNNIIVTSDSNGKQISKVTVENNPT